MVGRHRDRLFGRENIEVAGIENDGPFAVRHHRFPEIQRVIVPDQAQVDQAGVAAHAKLIEPVAGAHHDRKGARADLGVEWAAVAGRHLIEHDPAIGDQPGEHVEPPGRTLGIGDAG